MRARKDGTGVVFDIFDDLADRFLEIATHIKETNSLIDFDV